MKKTPIKKMEEKIAYILVGSYACTRAWEAWQVRTMTEADFFPLEEDEDVIGELVDLLTVLFDIKKVLLVELHGESLLEHFSKQIFSQPTPTKALNQFYKIVFEGGE